MCVFCDSPIPDSVWACHGEGECASKFYQDDPTGVALMEMVSIKHPDADVDAGHRAKREEREKKVRGWT